MSDEDSPDTTALIAQLASSDAGRRAEAAELLARAGDLAAPAAVPLVRACGDGDEQVREWAVSALEELGPPPDGVVADLVKLGGDRDPLVAYWAVTLLGRAGQGAASAVSALAACLASTADLAVRQRAAWALGQIGPAATASRDALAKAAGDADPRLARLAKEALESLGS
jgi:HEAT repeat protein